MTEPIKMLPPNHFWGQRSGIVRLIKDLNGLVIFHELRIKGKRACQGGRGTHRHKQPHENKGGVGLKARRRMRRYANPKLARRYRNG